MSIMQSLFSSQIKNFTFVDSNATITNSITIPSSAQDGDICVIANGSGGLITPSSVTPSGFTNVANVSGSGGGVAIRVMVSYKVLVSGDPGTTLTVMDTLAGDSVLAIVFRPNFTISSISTSTVNQQCTSGTPTNQTLILSTPTITRPNIGIVYFSSPNPPVSPTITGGPTFTQATFDSNNVFRYVFLGETSAAGNATVSMGDADVNGMISFTLNLT